MIYAWRWNKWLPLNEQTHSCTQDTKHRHHTTSTKKHRWSSCWTEILSTSHFLVFLSGTEGRCGSRQIPPQRVSQRHHSEKTKTLHIWWLLLLLLLSVVLSLILSVLLSVHPGSAPTSVSLIVLSAQTCGLGDPAAGVQCPSIQPSNKYLGGATRTQDTHNLDSYVLTGLLLAPITRWWISGR